jgi:hypothetical protein
LSLGGPFKAFFLEQSWRERMGKENAVVCSRSINVEPFYLNILEMLWQKLLHSHWSLESPTLT